MQIKRLFIHVHNLTAEQFEELSNETQVLGTKENAMISTDYLTNPNHTKLVKHFVHYVKEPNEVTDCIIDALSTNETIANEIIDVTADIISGQYPNADEDTFIDYQPDLY